jgi:hypothetical protein
LHPKASTVLESFNEGFQLGYAIGKRNGLLLDGTAFVTKNFKVHDKAWFEKQLAATHKKRQKTEDSYI